MSKARQFDIVVYGATGFTGKFVLKYLHENHTGLGVAIAGRSHERLVAINAWVGGDYPIIIADSKSEESLRQMARRARVCISCVGPYRFHGEPVVKACAAEGTNFVDISGEPEYMEKMQYLYSEEAKKNGCVIVSACGFDSVPADMGTVFAVKELTNPSNPSRPRAAVPNSVESFLSLSGGEKGVTGHFATYESAVHGFGSADELRRLRRKVREASKDQPTRNVRGATLRKISSPHWEDRVQAYALPFPGSDASVVRRSQQHIASSDKPADPVHYAAYFTIGSLGWTSVFVVMGGIFSSLAKFQTGRSILLKFPKLFSFNTFSHEGPTDDQLEQTTFAMTFYARGYSTETAAEAAGVPDVEVVTRVSGAEPGYVATPIIVAEAAITILKDSDRIPHGVLSPGAAFRDTAFIDRLQEHGIKFEVLEQ